MQSDWPIRGELRLASVEDNDVDDALRYNSFPTQRNRQRTGTRPYIFICSAVQDYGRGRSE